jgi:hypothetical protein
MWAFQFWKICGSLGINRLGVLNMAEVTARSVQAMHIRVSFMYIKYTHVLFILLAAVLSCDGGRRGRHGSSCKELQN